MRRLFRPPAASRLCHRPLQRLFPPPPLPLPPPPSPRPRRCAAACGAQQPAAARPAAAAVVRLLPLAARSSPPAPCGCPPGFHTHYGRNSGKSCSDRTRTRLDIPTNAQTLVQSTVANLHRGLWRTITPTSHLRGSWPRVLVATSTNTQPRLLVFASKPNETSLPPGTRKHNPQKESVAGPCGFSDAHIVGRERPQL